MNSRTVPRRRQFAILAAAFCLLTALLVVLALSHLLGSRTGDGFPSHGAPAALSGAGDSPRQDIAQLLDWRLLVGAPPPPVPSPTGRHVQGIALVMTRLTEPGAYALYRIEDGTSLAWPNTGDGLGRPLLNSATLAPGDYLLVTQAGRLFDTGSYYAFRVR